MFSDSLSRRDLLKRSGCGMGLLGLASVLQQTDSFAAPLTDDDRYQNPLAPREPHFPAKAKHVIHIFCNGGPSHVDTFDPKPSLQTYAGKNLPGENLKTERKTG